MVTINCPITIKAKNIATPIRIPYLSENQPPSTGKITLGREYAVKKKLYYKSLISRISTSGV